MARLNLDVDNIQDLKVFMQDGAQICTDEDLIDEIVNGQTLILCSTFEDYEKKGKQFKFCGKIGCM